MEQLEKTIFTFAARAYNVDEATLSRETNIKKDLSSQSLLMVSLVSMIENELEVFIPLTAAAKFETLGDVIDQVASVM